MRQLAATAFCAAIQLATSACAQENPVTPPSVYRSSVEGVFLDELPQVLCSTKVRLSGSSNRAVLDRLFSTNFSNDTIVVGLDFGSNIQVDLASPSLCSGVNAETVQRLFPFAQVELSSSSATIFEKQDSSRVLARRGLNEVDLSFEQFSDPCSVVRDARSYIDIDDILELRYRAAVPILYYNSANGKEVIVFDAGCENTDDLVSMVDFVMGQYLRHEKSISYLLWAQRLFR